MAMLSPTLPLAGVMLAIAIVSFGSTETVALPHSFGVELLVAEIVNVIFAARETGAV
jgi:hypothetical protein